MMTDERLTQDGARVLIFLRNGFKFEGVVLGEDEHFIKLREPRGDTAICKADISTISGGKR